MGGIIVLNVLKFISLPKSHLIELGEVPHAYNSKTNEATAGDDEFKVSLCYIVSL